VIHRGEIRWVDLGEPRGSEPGYRRPSVVVQANPFNKSRISTVVVVVLTSNLELARAPGNVLLPKSATGLPKDSVANISQILTVDRLDLDEKATGQLSKPYLEDLDDGLRLVLALEEG
jgi:mRNA interferase MazF